MTEVSVIIPAYNAAAYLVQAVDSALAQRGVEAEVIVIDDGSTDQTWQMLESFGGVIRKYQQPNAGLSRTRNRASENHSGGGF